MEADRETPPAPGRAGTEPAELRAVLRALVSEACGISENELDDARPLVDYGLTSRAAVALSGSLERRLNTPLPTTLLWETPTIERLVQRLAMTGRPPGPYGRQSAPGDLAAVAAHGRDPDRCDESSPARCPIAVIGIGCRLPGGVNGPERFFQRLLAGSDLVGHVPGRRWRDFATGPGAEELVQRTTRWGAFLDDIQAFDADHFGITPREAEVMDPQQRLLLEVSCEALDHAGRPAYSLEGSDTGVFVGISALEYAQLTTTDATRLTPWTGTGAAGSIAANRLSYQFDLHGPSITVDTACSSSLVAVHQACRSLTEGECGTALAGGVNVLLSPMVTASFQQARALAADGRCKPFDAAADGITRGEGCGVVVLKRLEDAQRDGDRILAVIRGTAVNSDGRSAGLMAPNPAAQERMLSAALSHARIDADGIDYVETHGTGTLLGDPIEAGALGAVLGRGRPEDQPLLIGSVKSNVGHLEGAAGIVGLIKTVLALHHRCIPPSLHFHEPNPHIDFTGSRLRVVTAPTAWPGRDRPARAGVSAFGFGGTNAHVVVEQPPSNAPADGIRPPRDTQHDDGRTAAPHVLVVSARNRQRIGDAAVALARRTAAGEAPALQDLAHTLARHRRGPVTAAVVARTHREATERLAALARQEEAPGVLIPRADDLVDRSPGTRRPVFVFSGHGSQWPGMGVRLLEDDPFFAAAVNELDRVYERQSGTSLSQLLVSLAPDSGAEHIQPALFGMHVALARTLYAYGVRPAAVLGHSLGEVSAAVVAGALDPADGLRVVLSRSQRLAPLDTEGAGAMAAVELPAEAREQMLARFPGVEIAVHSSPRRCTVAGPAHLVGQLVDELTAQGRLARLLGVGAAGHSAAVDPVLPGLRDALRTLRPRPADTRWYTTVLEDPRAPVTADGGYWCANVRQAVRLHQAVAAAAADGNDLFLEVSPHPLALVPLGETLETAARGTPALSLATLQRRGDEAVDLRAALTRLHFAGVPVEEHRLWPTGVRTALPSPDWRHRRHWFGRRGPGNIAAGRSHRVLGLRVDDPRSGAVLWQTDLGRTDGHHLGRPLHGRRVLDLPPAAALVVAAAREIHGPEVMTGLHIEDLVIRRWLPLSSSTPATITWEPDGNRASVAIHARLADGTWQCHASARVRPDDAHARHTSPDRDETVGDLPSITTPWAPAAQGGPARLPYEELLEAMLYAPFEAGAAQPTDAGGNSTAETMPTALRSLRLVGAPPESPCVIEVFPQRSPRSSHSGGLTTEGGDDEPEWTVVAGAASTRITASGLQLRPATRREVPRSLETLTCEIEWEKSPVPLPGRPGSVLLLVDEPTGGAGATSAAAVRAALEAANVHTAVRPVPPDGTAELIEHWRATAQEPAAVVLFLTREAPPHDPWALRTAVRTARGMASRSGQRRPSRLWLVTVGACAATTGESGRPDLACLRGLVRTLAIEEPALRACLVDLDSHPEAAQNLVQELLGDSAEDEVVWRAGTRLVARLASADLSEQQYEAPFVRGGGAYLVTGGLSGLGLETARRLADRGAGRLVLNGRRRPTPESRAIIDRLRSRGTSVTVVRGDIADPEVAARMVRAALGEGNRPRGVVHCAGVLHDRLITDLGDTDLETVMRPKIAGVVNLEAALACHDLDWWVLYSSAAALLGSPGQSAYAAANAWLDAWALRRKAEGKPATSIAWGPWNDIGAAPTEGAMALEPLTPTEGLDVLQALVVHNRTHTGVLHLDSARLLNAFPGLAEVPFLSRKLRTEDLPADDWAGRAGIDGLGADAADKVLRRLADRTAAVMGFGTGSVDESVPLPQLGLDSLMAVRIRNAAQQDFGVDLPTDLMLRGATLRDVGDSVLRALGLARQTEVAQPSPRPTGAADGTVPSYPSDPPPLPSTLQPRDAAERLVASVWAEVLGSPPADVRDDFGAAGGDRRKAEELVRLIRRRTGRAPSALTVGSVLERGTVNALADLVRPSLKPSGGRVVNVLRRPPTRPGSPPLFTFHPAGGPTSVYRPLTQLLPRDQAVYGLERLDALGTMELKAAHYVTLIKGLQPNGPYRLLGWSFGGCLAYETAQQLTDAGETVDFLGLIDTILPAALPGGDSPEFLLERFGRFAEYIEKTYGHHVELPYEELAATPDDEQIDVIMRLVAEAGLDMGPGIVEHQRTSYIDARIGERYTPRPYGGRVVLYRARRAQALTTALDPRYLRTEADLGWAPLCDRLEVVRVEGDHLSLIDPPHVAEIARHLGQCLTTPHTRS
ncbi:SDR family NAD(P)-dependent oxidoreductase [Streptomyces anandii]|uniref:SDR family NAD(P)-dependent oxidoreductase n=1 Tax=Streptomyces anandii TaxID=285454 RepID=UPI0036B4DCCD